MKILVALLLSALLIFPQQPSPEAPVFSVTTTLVQIDAVVTGPNGRYISDLTANDFQVLEDGKPQNITNVSYVRLGTPSASRRRGEPVSGQPPTSQPIQRSEVRRTIVLMVDDLGLSFESIAFVRNALRKFVEKQMQPGDLVALCRTGSGSGALQQFTTDPRLLLSLVNTIRWNPNGRAGVNLFESYGKTSQPDASPSGSSLARNVTYDLTRMKTITVGTLGAVQYIVEALRDMPGRKSVVLFSDGMQLFVPSQGPAIHQPGAAMSPFMESNDDVLRALRRLIDSANRAGAVVYTMHTAGLQPLQPDASDRIDLTGTGMQTFQGLSREQRQQTLNQVTQIGTGRDLAFNIGQQGLSWLAEETGGLAIQNSNDLNWGLDRVLDDQQGYYLIAYKPSDATFQEKHGARGYHRITVKVNRRGLKVRSRSGFFGITDEEWRPKYTTPADEMRAAMLSPFASSGLRVQLTALWNQPPGQHPVVRNLLYINPDDVSIQRDASGAATAHLDVFAVATSRGDEPVAVVARSFTIHIPPMLVERTMAQGLVYTLDTPVKHSGPYQIRVAVREPATGKIGSATQFIEIPDSKGKRLALTGIVLRQIGTETASALRRFQVPAQLDYVCLVQKGAKPAPPQQVRAEVRILREDKVIWSGSVQPASIENAGTALTGRLHLTAKMQPGNYYLQIVATGVNKKDPGATQWTNFEITN